MSEAKKKDDGLSGDNIFRIADELVNQVDRTKKFVIIMIAAIVVAVPISWHIAPLLTSTPFNFRIVGYITILVAAIFLGIGVRQWIVLSRWTRKYKAYKELQKRIDEKLDFDRTENKEE